FRFPRAGRRAERRERPAAQPWVPLHSQETGRGAQALHAVGVLDVHPFPHLLSLVPRSPRRHSLRRTRPRLGLLPYVARLPHHPGRCDCPAGARHALPRLARAVRSPPENRALDVALVALRLGYRRDRLLDVVSPVPVGVRSQKPEWKLSCWLNGRAFRRADRPKI